MKIECVFCRGDKAVELKLEFPLCQTCVEMREFLMEWAATKEEHGLNPHEWALDMIKFYSPTSPVASASVN